MAQLIVKKAHSGVNHFSGIFNINCGTITNLTNLQYPNSCKLKSVEYVIDRNTLFQIIINISYKMKHTNNHNNYNMRTIESTVQEINSLILIKIKKIQHNDDKNFCFKLDSQSLGLSDKTFFADKDDVIHLIGEKNSLEKQYALDINIQMELVCHPNIASLYDDDTLTDFELRGDNGSVHVHKAVLAAASPVLKQMLCGEWKEKEKGYMVLPGVSQKTLQNFKNFMYCCILPEKGLEHLMLLASQYMMDMLMQKSAEKLVKSLTDENILELLEFAGTNKMQLLIILILDHVQSKQVNLKDISILAPNSAAKTPEESIKGWLENYDNFEFSD